MHVDDLPQPGQHEVGGSGQVASVEPEAETQAMNKPADDDFRLGVPRLHGSHDARPLFLRQRFRHGYFTTMRMPGVPTLAIQRSLYSLKSSCN